MHSRTPSLPVPSTSLTTTGSACEQIAAISSFQQVPQAVRQALIPAQWTADCCQCLLRRSFAPPFVRSASFSERESASTTPLSPPQMTATSGGADRSADATASSVSLSETRSSTSTSALYALLPCIQRDHTADPKNPRRTKSESRWTPVEVGSTMTTVPRSSI